MTARAQAKLFAPKKFPKGLASAGQICFQLTPGQTHAVWKDYCEIVHPHGPEWTVKYLNDGGKLDVPKKELGLAIQPGQEITLKGRFVNLSHYAKNKAHFVYTDCISGDESEYESAKKKTSHEVKYYPEENVPEVPFVKQKDISTKVKKKTR